MKRYAATILIAAAMLVFLIATAGAIPEQYITGNEVRAVQMATAGSEMVFMPVPTTPPGFDMTGNFTKLEITPSYSQFTLKPGESKEMTVSGRNRDSKTVTLQPAVNNPPYSGPFVLDSSWIAITPATADVPVGGSAKFTVTASVPSDALRGSYNTMIIFTDEQYPSSYPTPFPNYIHQMSLGVNVVSPPVVQISTPYISDQIEAGKECRYSVEIKNTGNNTVQLNPKIGSDSYPMYGPSGILEPPLTERDFSMSAPATIPPGSTGTLNIVVTVPATASGYYNGYIDLGIDDPALMEGEGRIMVNFNVWKQPPEPFIKQFTLDAADPISIELTSGISGYTSPLSAGMLRDMPVREPTFDTILTGPEGKVQIHPVQKVIRGSISLGGDPMGVALQQTGTYQEMNTQYIVTYSAEGKPGTWQLSVMPGNAQSFEYKITLGGPDARDAAVNISQSREGLPGLAVPQRIVQPFP